MPEPTMTRAARNTLIAWTALAAPLALAWIVSLDHYFENGGFSLILSFALIVLMVLSFVLGGFSSVRGTGPVALRNWVVGAAGVLLLFTVSLYPRAIGWAKAGSFDQLMLRSHGIGGVFDIWKYLLIQPMAPIMLAALAGGACGWVWRLVVEHGDISTFRPSIGEREREARSDVPAEATGAAPAPSGRSGSAGAD